MKKEYKIKSSGMFQASNGFMNYTFGTRGKDNGTLWVLNENAPDFVPKTITIILSDEEGE